MPTVVDTGLENVIAARTRLSDVQGREGELTIAGFKVEDLAPRASFEETVFLLWNDRLPDIEALADFRRQLATTRALPEATIGLLREAASRNVPPMDALLMASGTRGLNRRHPDDDLSGQGMTALSTFPTIVAAYHRLLEGHEPVPPRDDLSHTANYLFMLTGEAPREESVRGLETYLNTVVDHGLNASTFAARVIIATRSDVFSAITGAVGALKGPLHGGAPGPALDMVFEIGRVDRAEDHIRAMLGRGERLMGFGHRVYKVRDPRADVLADAARKLYDSGSGDEDLYRLAVEIEQIALRLLEEHKPGRNLQTNVEYYTALLLHCLGFPTELFTPTFAIGRVAGWIAHCLEQRETDRIIRPGAEYVGPRDRTWVPIDER